MTIYIPEVLIQIITLFFTLCIFFFLGFWAGCEITKKRWSEMVAKANAERARSDREKRA